MAHWPTLRSAVFLAALGASLADISGTAAAAPGELDPSFAGGGKLTFAPGGKQSEIDDVAIQPVEVECLLIAGVELRLQDIVDGLACRVGEGSVHGREVGRRRVELR